MTDTQTPPPGEYSLRPLLRIVILWAAGLGAAAQFSTFSLFLPELGQTYSDAGLALGFLVSGVGLIGAVFGLMAGALASQIGLRRLLLIGLILGGVVSLVQSLELSLMFLLATRVLEGASHLMIVVTAPTLIALNSTDRLRPAAMTLWGTFFGLTFALTGWLGHPIVETKGLPTLFLLHGILMSLVALLVVIAIPQNKHAKIARATNSYSFALSKIYNQHKQAWTSPYIAAPAAGWLFYAIAFVALLSVLPGMMPQEDRAFVTAAMPIASILSSLTVGVFLLRRLSAVSVLIIGFSIATPFAIALSVLPTEPVVCIGLFAALGLVQGASFTSIPQLNTSVAEQALANGTLAQAGNLGNLIGTPLMLTAVGLGGAGAMSAVVVTCYLSGIFVHILLARKRKTARKPAI